MTRLIWLPSWVPWDVIPDESDTDDSYVEDIVVADMIEQIGESDPDVEDEPVTRATEMVSQSNVPIPESEGSDALVRISELWIGLIWECPVSCSISGIGGMTDFRLRL